MNQDLFAVRQGDAIETLSHVCQDAYDCIITDPAYESLEPHRAIGTTTRLQDWFPIFPNERMLDLFKECYRVLKNNSHIYVFCDQTTGDIVKPALKEAGFTFHKFIIWNKVSIGMGYHYRNTHEWIAFASKGKRKLNNLGVPDVLTVKKIHKPKYPTEKPPELSKILIMNSTNPGDIIMDMFCGSGSVGVAALQCGRRFAGIDLEERACALSTERLQTVQNEIQQTENTDANSSYY